MERAGEEADAGMKAMNGENGNGSNGGNGKNSAEVNGIVEKSINSDVSDYYKLNGIYFP